MDTRAAEPQATDTAQPGAVDRILPPALWRLFAVIWLPFLFYPLRDLVQLHLAPPLLAIGFAAAAAFVTLYLWLMLHDPFRDGARSRCDIGMHLTLITLLAALVLGLTFAYSVGWLWFFMFPGMAAGVNLPPRGAVLTVVGLTLLEGAIAWAMADWLIAWRLALPVLGVGLGMIGAARLVATVHELRAARADLARLAVAEERLRFARDLHDLLGHSLSAVAVKTALARRLLPDAPERAIRELDDVQAVTQGALREVREAVAGYRRPSLAMELANAREILAAAGIGCRCTDLAGQPPPEVEAVLAWAVREGVTNAVRHSRAQRLTIRIVQDGETVSAEIADDGIGAAPADALSANGGSGLEGLAERAAAIGGRMETESCPGGGFRLRVVLPLPVVAAGRRA